MIPAIVLAGGASSRMGRPKALLPAGGGHTFLSRIVAMLRAAEVEDVLVVLGHDAEAIRSALPETRDPDPVGGRPGARVVLNLAPHLGQLSSLQAALRVVDRPAVGGVLVTLVDVPLVSVQTVRAVLEAYRRHPAPIVRPVDRADAARHGHPVLFDRALFAALRAADPALGAKPVLRSRSADILDVPVTDEGAFRDIDSREDYERWIGTWPA